MKNEYSFRLLITPATFAKPQAWRLAWLIGLPAMLRTRLQRCSSFGQVALQAGLLWSGAIVGQAAPRYVVEPGTPGGTNAGNYDDWAIAATQIQWAVDVAQIGETVWVSNGVYDVGGITNWPSGTLLTNRVAIKNAITVRSANNDPVNTIIKGRFHSGEPGAADTVTNGVAAVRCVYMASGSSLIGFTLTNGATFGNYPVTNYGHYGGGVYAESQTTVAISNCVIVLNSAWSGGGGVSAATLFNCTVRGNMAVGSGGIGGGGGGRYATFSNCTVSGNTASGHGGGAYNGCIFYNCMVTGNTALSGGGGSYCTFYNCTNSGNTATDQGGGAYDSACYNSTITGNTAVGGTGGGIRSSSCVSNCTVSGNTASGGNAGGVYNAICYNSTISGNTANVSGGGGYGSDASKCTFSNCTVIGNAATNQGGGGYYCTFYNSTISGNKAIGNGGGGQDCKFFNCMVNANTGSIGGGANGGTFSNCTVSGNAAPGGGGGAYGTTFYNCLIIRNWANYGGGGFACKFINCTVSSNTLTTGLGGGGYNSYFTNSISWGNSSVDDFSESGTNNYSCGVGYTGSGSITNNPLFIEQTNYNYRLANNSPCINRGTNQSWMTGAVDLDGHRRIDKFSGLVDMGCYEYLPRGTMYGFR